VNRLFAALAPAGLLAACAHKPDARPEPIVTTVEVAVPVAVGCVPPNLAAAPTYPDTDQALKSAPDAASRYQLLYAGRKVRTGRLGELEPIVAGCPKATAK
jgi:hypothetical protein